MKKHPKGNTVRDVEQRVVFVGGGEIGSALATVLSRNPEVHVDIWDKDASKVPRRQPLLEIVPRADVLLMCVPSWTMRAALTSVRPYVGKDTAVISVAKGIERDSRRTMDELLAEALPPNTAIGVMGGGMLAAEMNKGLPAAGVLGSPRRDLFRRVSALFQGTNLYLEHTEDMHGVAVCGVLKNVYSIGLGMVSALALGSNFRGWFMQQALREMAGILPLLGGTFSTAYGPAGIGDLIATGLSRHSKNRSVGAEIARRGRTAVKSEGVKSLLPLFKLLGETSRRFPLLHALRMVLMKHADARETLAEAISRP